MPKRTQPRRLSDGSRQPGEPSAATNAVAPSASPSAATSGRHTLVVGATGSRKTVTQAWIAGRLIRAGHGAVVMDPKGDRLLDDKTTRGGSGRCSPRPLATPTIRGASARR